MDLVIQVTLAAVVVTAAITDFFSQRIPNWLVLPGAVLALCLHSVEGGGSAVLGGVLGWLAGFSLLIGFYAKGGMGAGDVKLMACIGAFVGVYRVFWVFVYTTLLGGVYALGIIVYSMVARTGWADTGRNLRIQGTSLLLSRGELKAVTTAGSFGSYPKLRYAIAMALAVATEHVVGALV